MSDIKWIKVAVDMFEDNKIEFLRSLPEGDALIVIWIQMLSIAGQSNMGGYLMVTEGIPYTEQLLSNKLRRQPVLLQFALETLTKLKMINIEDGPFHITKWEKHQNVDGMEKVRLLTNERVKKHRTKEKEKLETLQCNATETLQVTHGNATELELDLELEKDKKSSSSGITSHSPFGLYEKAGFGKLDSTVTEMIGDLIDTYTQDWVMRAMREAIRQGEAKKNLAYVGGTLKRWKAEGIDEPWNKEKEKEVGRVEKFEGRTQGIRYGSLQGKSREPSFPDSELDEMYRASESRLLNVP